MSIEQTPLACERPTQDAEATYDRWFRAKVEEALHSTHPRLPHDAAVARVKTLLQERRQARAARSVVR